MKNSLAKTHRKLTKEWHPTKNGNLTPSNVTYGSDKKVWWICSKGHSWQARIGNRVFLKTGCPYCSNNKVLKGYNDLATVNPKLAKEWHPTKNEDIKPTDVLPCGKYKFWWRCPKGHSYISRLYERSEGIGCPICANKKNIRRI